MAQDERNGFAGRGTYMRKKANHRKLCSSETGVLREA